MVFKKSGVAQQVVGHLLIVKNGGFVGVHGQKIKGRKGDTRQYQAIRIRRDYGQSTTWLNLKPFPGLQIAPMALGQPSQGNAPNAQAF